MIEEQLPSYEPSLSSHGVEPMAEHDTSPHQHFEDLGKQQEGEIAEDYDKKEECRETELQDTTPPPPYESIQYSF